MLAFMILLQSPIILSMAFISKNCCAICLSRNPASCTRNIFQRSPQQILIIFSLITSSTPLFCRLYPPQTKHTNTFRQPHTQAHVGGLFLIQTLSFKQVVCRSIKQQVIVASCIVLEHKAVSHLVLHSPSAIGGVGSTQQLQQHAEQCHCHIQGPGLLLRNFTT